MSHKTVENKHFLCSIPDEELVNSLEENGIVTYYVWLLLYLSFQFFANISCITLQLKEEE